MIATLQGKVESLGPDRVVVTVGGVGYLVFMPPPALAELGAPGNNVKIHTHLHVREDNLTLYGFLSPEQLHLFETLLTVSGIGPKIALAMLSGMTVEQLSLAISTGNPDVLTAVPGIGKKTASRIVLDLKYRIGAGWLVSSARSAPENAEVLAALTSLGYSAAEAGKAIAGLPEDSGLSLQERVKLALRALGGK